VIELLLTDDAQTAEETATKINAQNESRKEIEEGILHEIETRLSAAPELLNGRLLLLDGIGWHHGVVGIAASKLVDKYGKPVILFSRENGLARGSGRSVPGFSLIGAITACSEKLTRYGGHMLAAGMTLAEEDLPGFYAELQAYAAAHYPVMPVPELRVDWALSPEELTIESLQELSSLEPFGAGNEPPLFLLPGLRVEGIYPTADGKHLRLRFQFGNHLFYAVFFRMTAPAFPFSPGDRVDVVAGVSVGEWNGAPQLSVRVRDIRPQGLDQEAAILSAARYQSHRRAEYGELCPKEEIAPTREDVAIVYRYLRKAGTCFYSPEALYYRLSGEGIDLCRLRIALDVLTELGLIEKTGLALRVRPDAAKVELTSSKLLSALTGEAVGASI
jgi:single-stranded-DNA-specific exonuclease